jgi:hypothetical protein
MRDLTAMQHAGFMEQDLQMIQLSKEDVAIQAIMWDPQESNILCSFADGTMSLISY